jgi:hypothetical protein
MARKGGPGVSTSLSGTGMRPVYRSGVAHCARHAPAHSADDGVLAEEIRALRYVLDRLMREIKDLDVLVKHIPRVSSVAIQAARARHQIGERDRDDLMAFLGPILEEMDEGEAAPQRGA